VKKNLAPFTRFGNSLVALGAVVGLSGCLLTKSYESADLATYLERDSLGAEHLGQVRFFMDDFGSLSPKSLLAANIVPLKMYNTALLLAEPGNAGFATAIDGSATDAKIRAIMGRYGFIHVQGVANWRTDLAPEPTLPEMNGFIRSTIAFEVPLAARIAMPVKNFRLEVGNITCAACHTGVTYDAGGIPTDKVWLGSGNSSLNIDGYFNQIYRGLKLAAADPKHFDAKVREAYPKMDPEEAATITALLPRIAKEIKKYAPMNRVFPFPNGGPGLTNGIGAFKRDAHLTELYKYNPQEAGFVSIPDISNRGFRSSLTYDGVYGVPGKPRYETIDRARAKDPAHLDDLANLAAFFTYSAMGNTISNIEPNMYKVREIFSDFISELKPAPFPGIIRPALSLRGQAVFRASCAGCHGTYAPIATGIEHPELLSFPNRFVEQAKLGTDPYRWDRVDAKIVKFTKGNVFAKYIDSGESLGGYVAPILSGIWYTAPYLHNGSIPTLQQFMNPEQRAIRFQLGGHSLDYESVGIRGVRASNGDYLYPADYRPWSQPGLYDTREPGHSNKGHERPFVAMSADDKQALLEYLKLL
jgi:hypothetical protein